jgi:hypothetical protein
VTKKRKHHRHHHAKPKKPRQPDHWATLVEAMRHAPKKVGRCDGCGETHPLFPVALQVRGVTVWRARHCRMCCAAKHVRVAESRGL